MGDDRPAQDTVEPIMAGMSFRRMRELSDAELGHHLDRIASSQGFLRTPDDCLNELHRRQTMRLNRRLEWLTVVLIALAVELAILMVLLVWDEMVT